MFQVADWPSSEDHKISAPSPHSKKEKAKLKEGNGGSRPAMSSLKKNLDRMLNSPSMTQGLIAPETPDMSAKQLKAIKRREQSEEGVLKSKRAKLGQSWSSLTESVSGSVVHLLRRGIKFSSESEYLAFVNKGSGRNKKPKSRGAGPESEPVQKCVEPTEQKTPVPPGKTPPSKKFNIEKLSEALKQSAKSKGAEKESSSGVDEAKKKLKASQFRFLNEKMYQQQGAESLKMFAKDKDAFNVYHQGYMEQIRKWPVDPLHLIVASILKSSGHPVVADFGCGEGRLSRALASSVAKVHSFDFVAMNPLVTECDMARTPLQSESVDVAVFCLSLMGTNLRDYIKEANRVLKEGGLLKIAEVVSRFKTLTVDSFVQCVEKCGFKLKSKDDSNTHFLILDFVKVAKCKKKAPEFRLEPCFYKKR